MKIVVLVSVFYSCFLTGDCWAQDTLFRKLEYKGKQYFVGEVNPHQYKIEAFNKQEGKEEVYDFNTLAKKKNLLFIVNGGMFSPDLSPVGLFVSAGKTYNEINLKRGEGNFYMQPNGVFLLDKSNKAFVITSEVYSQEKYKPLVATQSGPMMVTDGVINAAFNKGSANLNIRNGVGVNALGNVIFIVSEEPVNFYELAELFRDQLGCRNALYLDGFVSDYYVAGCGKSAASKHTLAIFLTVSKLK